MIGLSSETRSKSIPHGAEDMVLIPGGAFIMGSIENEPEGPIHSVTLEPFLLDETPVTNGNYASFVEATGYESAGRGANGETWKTFATMGREHHPAILVNWYDAMEYAGWAGKRLPTEAEWEMAARGRLSGMRFPWGNERATDADANWNHTFSDGEAPPTSAVGCFPSNEFGLYDMVGNVWEWCSDWYQEDYYRSSPAFDPKGPTDGTTKVRRGASWNVRRDFRLRCSTRGAMFPREAHVNIGFRCARNVARI